MATPENRIADSPSPSRGWFLTVMTVLFCVLALSDFTKAIQYSNNPSVGGLVVLGMKIHGIAANAVAGPLVGVFLLTYAFGIWKMRSWVLPISLFYAFYVPVNLVMFWFLHVDQRPSVGYIAFYLFVSLTGSVGTALYLAYHRERLR
jgi:hypothetical protein